MEAGKKFPRMLGSTKFYGEKPLMDNLAETIHDPGSVDIHASWRIMLERVKTGTLADGFLGNAQCMAPQSLKKAMTRGYPFQVIFLCCFTIGRESGIFCG